MKFFVYTLRGNRASRIADPDAVNMLPAREALQSMYAIGERLLLKLPATPDEPFEVDDYAWADNLELAMLWCRQGKTAFRKIVGG